MTRSESPDSRQREFMSIGGFFGRMFGRGSDAPPAADGAILRAYGKLPFYPEYRRLEIAAGAPTTFSRWMDDGRLAWCRSPTKSEHGITRPSRLVLRLTDTKELVIASIWDSRDSAGRVFPFSFFAVCAPDALGVEPVEQWVAARGLHLQFEQAHAELRGLAGGGDFYRNYQRRYVSVRPGDLGEQVASLRRDAAGVSAADWFKAWSPDSKLDPAAWFAGMQKRAERWTAEKDASAELAVNCPLAAGISYPAQAVCWLALLAGLAARAGRTVSFIGPGVDNPEGGALNFLLRDVVRDDFQLLTSDAARYGFVEGLASVPQGRAAASTDAGAAPTIPLLEWMLRNAPKSA